MPAMEDTTFRMGLAASAADRDAELCAGTPVGDYAVVGLLAVGGHGSVYAAEHRSLGHRVAVKVLRQDLMGSAEMVTRFFREARAVSRIRSPGIVDVLDVGTLADGRPYCVMELLGGRSLAAIIRERAPLAAGEAIALLAPICEALGAAHGAGVVHRDVKAGNVMVVSEDDPPVVKLLDFGVAKFDLPGEAGYTSAAVRLGSAGARAPEQVRAQGVDARTDVYALGVLLHQMLTGHLPFESDDPDEIERMHLEAEPPRPSRIAGSPVALDAVVARAMAKSPQDRYPSAAAFLEAAGIAAGAAARPPLERLPAVAIHVALRPTSPEPDEEALAAQAAAADLAEAALGAAGFALPLRTAGEVLGVRLLPSDPAASRAARAQAVALARSLPERMSGPAVRALVAAHADDVEVRRTSEGPEIAGGPLCQTTRWAPGEGAGFSGTPQALADL
jgi:eukaryotic-like serine/threonine-protein kinase